MSAPLWQPTPAQVSETHLAKFLSQNGFDVSDGIDYDAAHAWSVNEIDAFWNAVWDYCEIRGEKNGPAFREGQKMFGARFFEGTTLNFAENLLRGNGNGEALVFTDETGEVRRLSWDDLRKQTASVASWLKAQGVTEGDRVAAVMPNMPETIVAMLAASSLGAVFSSCSPDFGEQGILDRFGQIEPKVLIACNGYYYNGKTLDITGKINSVAKAIPSLEARVNVAYVEGGAIDNAEDWRAISRNDAELSFTPVAFDAPLYIMFSSGTTGKPKCIVHSVGGTLIQHLKEHILHCNEQPGDRVFYFTTCGWMMWNWLVSALASEATLLLYDGSPFYQDGKALFDFLQNEKATLFGTSAKFIDAINKAGLRPRDTHDLSSVKLITSTGSPLVPEGFDYVYDAIKPDAQLASISGGTDIVSCFILGNPVGPVWRGEIQAPGLGMAVEIWDDDGKPIKQDRGELVCVKPFPCQPIGFWNDPEDARYRAAYFEQYDDVWCHGDFALQTEHGGYVMLGRSDATLNPGGVRIGTAEIYRQVEKLDEVIESVAIGQNWEDDVRVVLFVVLREGVTLDEDLTKRIKTQIRTGATPRHVPAVIVAVKGIPRTKSGKITELAVRDVVHGREIKNVEALANPEALELYKGLEELQ